MPEFFSTHWFDALQSVFIVASFLLAMASLRQETHTKKIQNLMLLTQNHREVWSKLYVMPELARVEDVNVNLSEKPVTALEELLVREAVLHLATSFEAAKYHQISQDGMKADIAKFFNKPIPRKVWEGIRKYQNRDFVNFVEGIVTF